MNDANLELHVWQLDLRTADEFRDWLKRDAEVISFRRALQVRLEAALPKGSEGVYFGYCIVCASHSHFVYDWNYGDGLHVNWRERLVCRNCKLNNRLRLSFMAAEEIVDLTHSRVYLTEQLTPFAALLKGRAANLVCSEFLGKGMVSGRLNWRGVRHEDLTKLSFNDAAFDLVLSFDVLEHIPNYAAALSEIARILSPGGTLAMTVPLNLASDETLVRATVDAEGNVMHLTDPEYHGDPVNPQGGILCFYHFGWKLLRELQVAGFSNASFRLYWSSDLANIGDEQVIVFAQR